MSPPDVVYPLRRGNHNDELRYSLRSLQNLPHGKVICSGYIPNWLTGVTAISRDPQGSNWYRSRDNVLAALEHASDPFYLFNDDFYVMSPVEEVPIYHAGLLNEVIERYRKNRHGGAYWRGMVQTFYLLQEWGYSAPYGYELHVPLLVHHAEFRKALEIGSGIEALAWRTLYANLAGLGGEEAEDCKVIALGNEDLSQYPFLSSNDNLSYHPIGKFLESRFLEPSTYESDRH